MQTRRFLLSIVAILSVSYASAQSQTTLGIKMQTGQAWHGEVEGFLPNGYEDYIPHYGFSVELFRALSPKFALGLAPGYMRRGTSFEAGFINGFGPPQFLAELNLNYLQFPVYVKAEVSLFDELSLFGQTGAGFSYLLNGYRDVDVLRNSGFPLGRLDLDFDGGDEEINRFDFGWSSEVGFSYTIGRDALLLSAGYYHGFLDVDQKNESLNRNWSIGLGYQRTISKVE